MIFIKTLILDAFDVKKDAENIKRAASVLQGGGLVAFPTETVYGLGANALNEAAVKKIFVAKGRPQDNPLIIHIAAPADAELYTHTNELYYKLAEAFMPGPLTIVLEAKQNIPPAYFTRTPAVWYNTYNNINPI